MGLEKKGDFIIEEIPGEEDLWELLAMSIVEYINDKAGREIVRLKPKAEITKVKVVVKIDKSSLNNVRLRG